MGDEQSTIMVDVINSFVVANDGSPDPIVIDRVDWSGEHEADLSLACAMIRSSDEAYSSRSRKNDARRWWSGVIGVSAPSSTLFC